MGGFKDDGALGVGGQDQGPDSMLGRHGDLTSAYKSSYARHSGVSDSAGNDTAYGTGLGGGLDNGFSTSDYNSSDAPSGNETGYGKGIGGSLPMVRRAGGADDQTDTGQSGGRSIA
jgi:hypothetical protein